MGIVLLYLGYDLVTREYTMLYTIPMLSSPVTVHSQCTNQIQVVHPEIQHCIQQIQLPGFGYSFIQIDNKYTKIISNLSGGIESIIRMHHNSFTSNIQQVYHDSVLIFFMKFL